MALVLFLAVGSAAAQTAQNRPWDTTVASLATKIAAKLGKPEPISVTVKNQSSLDPSSVAEIRAQLEQDLKQRGFRLSGRAGANPEVEIELSENLLDFVWAAKIRRGESEYVVIVSISRSAAASGATPEPAVSLRRQLVWEQPGAMLDFAKPGDTPNGTPNGTPNNDSALVVLEPDRLAFYARDGSRLKLKQAVEIAHTKRWPRDVHGKVDVANGLAMLPGTQCSGNFAQPDSFHCSDVPETKESTAAIAGETIEIDGHGVEAARLGDVCGAGNLVLASGAGDWTEKDALQANVEADHNLARVGDALEIPGPVLALWPADDSKSARMISRNLETGMYEASIVSVSCNR